KKTVEALHHGELKMMIGGKRAASSDGGAGERWSAWRRRKREKDDTGRKRGRWPENERERERGEGY
ncbi:hypothetical protein WH47_07548, partial [Habropoda laboriosa]